MSDSRFSRRTFLGASAALSAPGALAQTGGAGAFELPFRHIHLDFHTNPAISGVAGDFRADEFAATLKAASVNSITLFAKCHHGMAYYPTKVGMKHPNLKIDLLGESLDACHRAGIRAAVYISTMYDQWAWNHHGDWRVLDPDGRVEGFKGDPGALTPLLGRLCLNTGYLDYLAAQAEEILRGYSSDGIFYDNMSYQNSGCCCASCNLERDRLKLDSRNAEHRYQHYHDVLLRAMGKLSAIARERRPRGSIVFNGPFYYAHPAQFLRAARPNYTHVEYEGLPGKRGYEGISALGRYYRNFGLETMGMTGSFHRSWGDFGTVRTQAALDYECFGMLAQGVKCAIGDHLHPAGRLHPIAYQRIGRTFRSVAEKEPWCRGAKAVTEIGVLLNLRQQGGPDSVNGAATILEQLHHQFDLVDPLADFDRYAVIVAPDRVRLDEDLRKKLLAFLARGGRLILSHESGLDLEGKRFVLPVGLSYQGPWQHEVQYIEVLGAMAAELPAMVEMAYEKGAAVKAEGAEVLGRAWVPYFDRNYKQFQVEQTPFCKPTDFVTVARHRNIFYLATPVFRDYARNGYPFHRDLVGSCLRRLLEKPLVIAGLPLSARVTVTGQPERRIVHILSYQPERRAPNIEVVEDVIPLRNVRLALRTDTRPKRVYVAPAKQPIPFTFTDGYARLQVPEVVGHQMVVFE